eukprot:5657001-Ditylum_brightwellii.AAC.1
MALNRATSKASITHLVDAIMSLNNFKQDIHQTTMETGRAGRIGRKEETYKGMREAVEENNTGNQKQGLDCASKSLNLWISVLPCLANNSMLGKDEFKDMIIYCYRITPKDLPAICNGCGKQHSLQHAMQCKSGDFIFGCHDNACNDLGHVSTQAYSPSLICNDPKIKSSWEDKSRKECYGDTMTKEDKDTVHIHCKHNKEKYPSINGDLMIWHLCKHQTDCILDICITDTDAKSYISHSMESVL